MIKPFDPAKLKVLEAKIRPVTELELQVLYAVVTSDYQHDRDNPVGTQVWYLTEDDVDMKPGQLAGAISSCVKKGYVTVIKDGNDSTIAITKIGYETLLANQS